MGERGDALEVERNVARDEAPGSGHSAVGIDEARQEPERGDHETKGDREAGEGAAGGDTFVLGARRELGAGVEREKSGVTEMGRAGRAALGVREDGGRDDSRAARPRGR